MRSGRPRPRLGVNGSLRADGPGGSFRVIGDGERLEIHAPHLRSAWRLGRESGPRTISRLLTLSGLQLRIVVRGNTIAAAGEDESDGFRVSWPGVLGACLALAPGRKR